MNNYRSLSTIKNILDQNDYLIKEITSTNKESFSKNDTLINIAIGMINEIKEVLVFLDQSIYIFNKDLFSLISPIQIYSSNLFTHYNIVNSYKLYDCIKIDLLNLKVFLDKIV